MPLPQLGRWILKVPGAHHHKNWNSPIRETQGFRRDTYDIRASKHPDCK